MHVVSALWNALEADRGCTAFVSREKEKQTTRARAAAAAPLPLHAHILLLPVSSGVLSVPNTPMPSRGLRVPIRWAVATPREKSQ